MVINNKLYKRIEKKLNYANLKIKPMAFIYLRLLVVLIIFVLGLVTNKYGYVVGPLSAIIVYCLFEYVVLDKNIIERMEKLEKDALEFFPIFLMMFYLPN